ncbi:MAG: Rrf2 family transcriptional regulator [Acidobacteria bacterium]|nr:Rrf2 family transcriptional regulator [Acidobacteriota bacterium]
MILSKRCEYAFRALVHLAQAGRMCDTGEISRVQQAPHHFIAKVLQELKAKGFVKSVQGVGGGFQLAVAPETVRLIDVVCAVDGDHLLRDCLYGLMGCTESRPCPLHNGWKEIRGHIEVYLRDQTLADLVLKGDAEMAGLPGRSVSTPEIAGR